MKNKTKEEAYLEMLKPSETITFKVQNSSDKLAAIKDSQGDGFYIRYLNYSSCFLIHLQQHHSILILYCRLQNINFTVE